MTNINLDKKIKEYILALKVGEAPSKELLKRIILQLTDIQIDSKLEEELMKILKQYSEEGLLEESSTGEYKRVQVIQDLDGR